MQCPFCGRHLNGDERFCSGCGALIPVTETPPVDVPEETPTETPAAEIPLEEIFKPYFQAAGKTEAPVQESRKETRRTKKKKKSGFKAVLVSILVIVIARLAVYGVRELLDAGVDAVEDAVQNRRDQRQEQQEEVLPGEKGKGGEAGVEQELLDRLEAINDSYGDSASEEYTALFTEAGIVETSALPFEIGTTDHAFAEVDEDGWIYRYEFACEGDIICTMADTVFIPLDGYSDEEIASLVDIYEETFAFVDELDFCSVTIQNAGSHLLIVVLQEDMDDEDNIDALVASTYMDPTGGEGLLSMELTADGLREQGMIEK